ncbi:hypothetical protein ACFLYO_10365 [Chloroflexota bacterium]
MCKCAFVLLILVLLVCALPAAAQDEDAVICPGSPPVRLTAGEMGRVTPGSGNRLRDQPTTAGAEVGFIPGGAAFTVLAGPVCADDFAWWQVAYGDVTGWTVEGSDADYWLEPVDLVFASWVSGESKLMALDDQGGNVVDLGEPGVFQMMPSVSPDGSRIAYLAEMPDGGSQLRVMSLAGGDAQVLDSGLEHGYGGFVWSPDGAQIAFTLDTDRGIEADNMNIYVIAADGGQRRALTSGTIEHSNVSWSPDGSQLAFAANTDDTRLQLHLLDVASGEVRPILAEGYSIGRPVWSPDGSALAFSAAMPDAPPGGSAQVFVINADGSDFHQLTWAGLHASSAVWSPDSSHLAFIAAPNSAAKLFTVHVDGSDLRQLTDNDASEACPAWSPDGSQLAFTSDPDGPRGEARSDVYVVNTDGSDLRQLTDNDRREECPLTWVTRQ